MEELLSLLKTLSNDYIDFKEQDKSKEYNYYIKLKEIYANDDFRHSYAELSKFSEKELTPDGRVGLVANLDKILSFADDLVPKDDKIIKRIGKLADHLELESIRLDRIEQIKTIGNNVKLERMQIQTTLRDNSKNAKRLKHDIKSMNAQMVSVLGIFSAVIIAFFGGLSYFTSVFANANEMPIYKALMLVSLLGLVIFNTVLVLLRFILLIVRDDTIKNKKLFGGTTVKTLNGILITLLITSIIMWIIGFNPDSKSNKNENNSSSIVQSVDN